MDGLQRRMCIGAIIGAIGMVMNLGAVAGEHPHVTTFLPARHTLVPCTDSGSYPYLIIGRFTVSPFWMALGTGYGGANLCESRR